MQKIELFKGLFSSRIGFGCASVLGAVDGVRARRALHCALDHDINHFDLARSYGYGEAERFIGQVLKGRRNEVIIASKFGIKANWKAGVLKPVKPLVRLLKSRVVKEQKSITNAKGIGDRFHDRIEITPRNMILSLEKSLSELQVDYLDHFFVHEPISTIYNIEELIFTSENLKKAGKIRCFGIAFNITEKHLHEAYLDKFDLVQFNKPVIPDEYHSILKERGAKKNVLFSALSGRGAGQSATGALQQLAYDFQESVILCSMFSEEHIKENASLFN